MEFDLIDNIKQEFFQDVAVLLLLYGCNTWTFKKHLEKKLDGNCKRMLHAVLNKLWKQNPIKQQLYGHLPQISLRWASHTGYCWGSKNEFISDVSPIFYYTTHMHTSLSQPAKAYINQLSVDSGCYLDNLPRLLVDRDRWQERVKGIHVISIPW